ncbi:efflux transporter outer membrane subunit [Haloferula chungangensis]|uniref:Efflux transporter outer membrane subunit n=1 Tax=Haloferula chungangensis TaxID=1048331 RepID=A0ABW2L3R0_9BACT
MQRNSPKATWGLIICLTSLTACNSLQFESPREAHDLQSPPSWEASSSGREGKITQGWLSDFSDPGMTAAVERAMAYNSDLAAAAARMREAEYIRIAGQSRTLPNVALSSSGAYSMAGNGSAPTTESERYGLNISASWEVDVWKRLRDLNEASQADVDALRALYRGARLSLAASTAKSWCNLIAAEQQLELAKVTLDSFESNLRISERNYIGTGQGSLDVQFGRTNVASARRALEARRLERDDAARGLETLSGQYPSGRSSAGSDLPNMKRSVPAGIPADMVERRPDLEVARARIYASAKRADAIRKNLLPNIRLTSSGGNSVAQFQDLFDPNWLAASIAASVAQSVYSGGELTNLAHAAVERNKELIADYTQTALIAYREVESALSADDSLRAQEEFLIQEVKQAALAEKQATRDYADGIEGSDILDVLEAQRRNNNAKASLIRLRNERLQNRIDLHLALGGDFKTA